jgi:hypothetical protein
LNCENQSADIDASPSDAQDEDRHILDAKQVRDLSKSNVLSFRARCDTVNQGVASPMRVRAISKTFAVDRLDNLVFTCFGKKLRIVGRGVGNGKTGGGVDNRATS